MDITLPDSSGSAREVPDCSTSEFAAKIYAQPGLALTVGEIRAAYDAILLTAEEARRRLHESGMSPADAAAAVERWATEGRNWAQIIGDLAASRDRHRAALANLAVACETTQLCGCDEAYCAAEKATFLAELASAHRTLKDAQ